MSSKTIIYIFIVYVAIWSFTFGDELRYTIKIVEDTVLIGEPIIVKCEITNTGSKATEIYIFLVLTESIDITYMNIIL
jgi:hypothetical protein